MPANPNTDIFLVVLRFLSFLSTPVIVNLLVYVFLRTRKEPLSASTIKKASIISALGFALPLGFILGLVLDGFIVTQLSKGQSGYENFGPLIVAVFIAIPSVLIVGGGIYLITYSISSALIKKFFPKQEVTVSQELTPTVAAAKVMGVFGRLVMLVSAFILSLIATVSTTMIFTDIMFNRIFVLPVLAPPVSQAVGYEHTKQTFYHFLITSAFSGVALLVFTLIFYKVLKALFFERLRNRKGQILFLIIFVWLIISVPLALIAASDAAKINDQKMQKAIEQIKKQKPTLSLTESAFGQPNTWITYTGAKFKFNYPKDWIVSNSTANSVTVSKYQPSLCSSKADCATFTASLNGADSSSSQDYNFIYNMKIGESKEKPTNSSGTVKIWREQNFIVDGIASVSYLGQGSYNTLTQKNGSYIFLSLASKSLVLVHDTQLQLFINSFKLI